MKIIPFPLMLILQRAINYHAVSLKTYTRPQPCCRGVARECGCYSISETHRNPHQRHSFPRNSRFRHVPSFIFGLMPKPVRVSSDLCPRNSKHHINKPCVFETLTTATRHMSPMSTRPVEIRFIPPHVYRLPSRQIFSPPAFFH